MQSSIVVMHIDVTVRDLSFNKIVVTYIRLLKPVSLSAMEVSRTYKSFDPVLMTLRTLSVANNVSDSEIRVLSCQWCIKRGRLFCSSVTRIVRKRAFCHPIGPGMYHLRRTKTTRDNSVAS